MSDLDDDMITAYDEVGESLTSFELKQAVDRYLFAVFIGSPEDGNAASVDIRAEDDVIHVTTRVYQDGDFHGEHTLDIGR